MPQDTQSHPRIQPDLEWFTTSRFGMFIHFGLYALAARHEWVKNYEELSDATYQRYFDHFNPDLFDAKLWARRAREAGMRYVVLTSKHHEGFCLWDSAYTDYKVTNTPFGRDLIAEYVEAFRAEGLKVGFYYSLLDWHHPDFPVDSYHPQRNSPDAEQMNEGRDIRRYAAYMRDQVRELLTRYGTIDILWFDFSYPDYTLGNLGGKSHEDWESEKMVDMVYSLQPHIIMNNRLDLDDLPGSVHTPEQFVPREAVQVNGEAVTWESCHTFSGSWGYFRDETSWKSPAQLIQLLIDSVALGGNLLMNVGPTGRGTFDERAVDALDVYGAWLDLHGRSIYGCTQSNYPAPRDCRLTQKGDRVYVHVFNWPNQYLHIDGLGGKVAYAQLLNDASEVPMIEHVELISWNNTQVRPAPGTLTLKLPVHAPGVVVPVIELFMKPSNGA
ncbi:alpha-L-fucosidase [Deinococcus sp. UYEF24]